MTNQAQMIFIGEAPQRLSHGAVQGEYVSLLGETYYKIGNFDAMEPFFMSIVSSADHWLFIASTGGLSAGRGNAERAIFPYYTVDKITENSENTGHKAILLVRRGGRTSLWEPFSDRQRGSYTITRNLYKNETSTSLVFEEINHDLGLNFRYAWRTSDRFGFVKTSWVRNIGDSPCQIEILDGLQNLLPAHVGTWTQNVFSMLLDSYKRGEVDTATGLAIFALNAIVSDMPEPGESLLATTVTQIGLTGADYLLSSDQLDAFRSGKGVTPDTEIRGQRSAYFAHTTLDLAPGDERSWHLIADGYQDAAAIAMKDRWLRTDPANQIRDLEEDIAAGQRSLWRFVASSDGVQLTNSPLYAGHHFANVMFSVMRGGVPVDQYWIQTADFTEFVTIRNRGTVQDQDAFFKALPPRISAMDLYARAEASGSPDLIRLSYAYLPLTFSRRHGDPSRPWNRFAINIKKPDGSLKLDYEGNWRDIFQNWEALAYAFPEYIESMISIFLNATTVDGYNPYRITHHGLDWEVPEPHNPWANIGYWSDHQIIYLQKLMEISAQVHPDKLRDLLTRPMFSYANIPYRLKPYSDLLQDANHTIDFDWDLERLIEARRRERGTDANLVWTADGKVLQVSLAEKLLTLLLAKLANFVPEGGIWMNTQRPEWNDANNALVGKGLSVVTLCYLRRYLVFCRDLFRASGLDSVALSAEVQANLSRMNEILAQFRGRLQGRFDDRQRRQMMDALGEAGSAYRWGYYKDGLSGQVAATAVSEIVAFLDSSLQYVEHSLRANKRPDDLYHSYNILRLKDGGASVGNLYEMLEGQVAILSSGMLSGEESVALLKALRKSALYRADQHTYILYPDKVIPGFREKNRLTEAQVSGIALFGKLIAAGDASIVTRDADGFFHFSGQIHNFRDVNLALEALKKDPHYATLIDSERGKIRDLFETTFHHDEFTGRSGAFFAYEGLGSIYWHMVAKLLLAVQEVAIWHANEPSGSALLTHYADIRKGLSIDKTPDVYGSFPTDPYSHTPKGQGAKQPGMTGMVKELILTRLAELGLSIDHGRLKFDMRLLNRAELLSAPANFAYEDVSGRPQILALNAGSLAYTCCQTPIVLTTGSAASITVHRADGGQQVIAGNMLDEVNTRHIFLRDGVVHHLTVTV